MTPVLFDTNVVSESVRARPEARVLAFMRQQTDPLLSAVTFDELAFGAERVTDAQRVARLSVWIAGLQVQFAGRIVSIDATVAELSGRMRGAAASGGRAIPMGDCLIAACAVSRGAVVATRNVRDFTPLGVPLIDPWAA